MAGGALLAVRIVFLDHVQNLHIHAVRANFQVVFSVGSTSDGPSQWHWHGRSSANSAIQPRFGTGGRYRYRRRVPKPIVPVRVRGNIIGHARNNM